MSSALRTILYVEDDLDIAEVALMTLQDLGGFEVVHCDSGPAALRSFASVAPQMVLMDVMMPEMDGPETMRRLRNEPGGAEIPVVFMTARAQVHEQAIYRQLGALGVIVKPFDPMALNQQIRELWESRDAA
jgi:CheY-like chemotaxis protein